jgi:septum formation protein
MLAALGWKFEVHPSPAEEEIFAGELPQEAALRLAVHKGRPVAAQFPDRIVLAADTLVTLDGKILGKPADRAQALDMLMSLAGRTHRVMTGLALFLKGECLAEVETTEVTFRDLPPAALQAYADTGEGDDKAGAYGIQGRGALLVSSISGCYFNVVGLPLARLSGMLTRLGVDMERQWRSTSR